MHAREFVVIVSLLVSFHFDDALSQQPAAPGTTFSECTGCPEMIVLPAGDFMIGSPVDEPLRRDNEPQKRITFAQPFAIATTPVTWDQWEACVRERWCDGAAVENALRTLPNGEPDPDYADWGRGTRPVVGVSWYDAQHFVGWLNAKTNQDGAYRLPSEAEWEYAARGGTTTAFPWGPELDYDYGNFGTDEEGLGGKAQGRDVWLNETSPVASFPANAFGVYDMHGNIFEWTEDCYEADRAHTPTDGSANTEGNCANRVFRSGTYLSNPYMQRSARRGAPYPATLRGRNYLGFRVVRTLSTPAAVDIGSDGTVRVPAHAVPISEYLTSEGQAYVNQHLHDMQRPELLVPGDGIPPLLTPYLDRQREMFDVEKREILIGGVHAYDYAPAAGISRQNRNRVLINLHGGGFSGCWPGCAELESIPVAALGRIRVISLDYRQGPRYRFPAASEDVAAAYRALLEDYPPENIGIYGCSAGGMLAGMAVAWFQAHDLPKPGAIGVLCAGMTLSQNGFGGDAAYTTAAIGESRNPPPLHSGDSAESPLG
ncbi:MAG: SUMF1/EgtB/PvdO family nonheme iron enzyme, partial [Gammaproteobacteria bacterium]